MPHETETNGIPICMACGNNDRGQGFFLNESRGKEVGFFISYTGLDWKPLAAQLEDHHHRRHSNDELTEYLIIYPGIGVGDPIRMQSLFIHDGVWEFDNVEEFSPDQIHKVVDAHVPKGSREVQQFEQIMEDHAGAVVFDVGAQSEFEENAIAQLAACLFLLAEEHRLTRERRPFWKRKKRKQDYRGSSAPQAPGDNIAPYYPRRNLSGR